MIWRIGKWISVFFQTGQNFGLAVTYPARGRMGLAFLVGRSSLGGGVYIFCYLEIFGGGGLGVSGQGRALMLWEGGC